MSTPQTNYTPMPPANKSNAALVVILVIFGLIVVVGVAAAMFLPKMLRARMDAKHATPAASTQSPAAADQPAQPAPTQASSADAASPPTSPTPDSSQPAPTADAPGSASDTLQAMGHAGKAGAKSSGAKVGHGSAADYGTSAADAQAAAQQAAEREAEQRELDKLAHEHSLLSTRMASVDSTIETMKQEQAHQGLGMRGDIVATQQRLHGNMNRLESAIQAHDLKAAQQYMDLCDRDADTLDKFVGH
ncbi:hypothetical protein Acid345_2163 [Candidatus Koribacter versatilis Ellin345]|uniref:Uncharacterized protein n=1 Tax=Koribacter versatilis (strain Ellin345) TaxID=204669 RepID=Q1IPN6_KORVE|nr:hypothetical protein [Candidatus Koribacter versatilis]ABF41164.1 hypothetical protein Acid345_2163 [Candidatus Koribacter versatilis Ellin345]